MFHGSPTSRWKILVDCNIVHERKVDTPCSRLIHYGPDTSAYANQSVALDCNVLTGMQRSVGSEPLHLSRTRIVAGTQARFRSNGNYQVLPLSERELLERSKHSAFIDYFNLFVHIMLLV